MVRSDVFRNARGLPWLARVLAPLLQRLLAISPEQAARTPAALAHDAELADRGGLFYGPRLRPLAVPERARASLRSRQLWEASEALVKPYVPALPALPALARSATESSPALAG